MEDNRDKFTVILAGYTKEMQNLLKLNPGLKSRINLDIEFEDYKDYELLDIAKSMADSDYYKFNSCSENQLHGDVSRIGIAAAALKAEGSEMGV